MNKHYFLSQKTALSQPTVQELTLSRGHCTVQSHSRKKEKIKEKTNIIYKLLSLLLPGSRQLIRNYQFSLLLLIFRKASQKYKFKSPGNSLQKWNIQAKARSIPSESRTVSKLNTKEHFLCINDTY